jgi:hypothetical protein
MRARLDSGVGCFLVVSEMKIPEPSKTIYIRLIDGTSVLVPVEARQLGEQIFQITDNDYLDLENDDTNLWEFFPGDVVNCKFQDDLIVAEQLLESSFPHRNFHAVLFRILDSDGKLNEVETVRFQQEIKILLERKSLVSQSEHPLIKKWITENN